MSDTPIEEVTDFEVVDAHITSRLLDLHTSFPAKVESYDASEQTVDVVPCLNKSLPDGAGNFVTEPLPKIGNVKVCFPRCGSFFVSFPIQAGDYVLVVCAERNIGNWRASGNQGDPGDVGMHTLDGAIAIPGVYPDAKALQNADATNMVMGSDTSPNGRIVCTSNQVQAGGDSDFVALSAKVKAWFDAFNAAVTGWVVAPNDGGAALKLALGTLVAGMPSTDVAAQNLKAT